MMGLLQTGGAMPGAQAPAGGLLPVPASGGPQMAQMPTQGGQIPPELLMQLLQDPRFRQMLMMQQGMAGGFDGPAMGRGGDAPGAGGPGANGGPGY